MTKQNFIALADKLRQEFTAIGNSVNRTNEFEVGRYEQWLVMRDSLADFCQSQNPAFNRERWLGYIAGTNGKNGGRK